MTYNMRNLMQVLDELTLGEAFETLSLLTISLANARARRARGLEHDVEDLVKQCAVTRARIVELARVPLAPKGS